MTQQTLEVWMRGPINGVPSILQPVAHTLLQVSEDIRHYTYGLNDHLLWEKPAGMASIGFHLQHIHGVIDRLFTYAAKQSLSEQQFVNLRNEGVKNDSITLEELLLALENKINWAVNELRETDEKQLSAIRYLGRKRIPTTLIGLLFHAAEHSQRHIGQMLVTIRMIEVSTL